MKGLTQNLSFRTYLTLGPYEEDLNFKELLNSLAKRGLLFAGLLGIVCVIIFVFSHTVFLNKSIVWFYSGFNTQDKIMLVDKVVLIMISLVLVMLSRLPITLMWCRFVLSLIVWLASLIILLEDIVARDTSFSAAFIIIGLIIAVGTMPMKGSHILSLSVVVIFTTIITIRVTRFWFGVEAVDPEPHQIVYLFIVTFLLTGLSSHIYLNRYDQFLAQQKAKKLSEKLKERTRVLQKMSLKSENQAIELKKNEELKDKFFANISHEFRTPLTLIMGPLKDYYSRKGYKITDIFTPEVVGLMYRNSQKMQKLINQLLDLAKIEAGEIQLSIREIDLGNLVTDLIAEFQPLAKKKNLTITTFFQGDSHIAKIDPDQIERAFGNLLSNAIKYTPPGGSISVYINITRAFETDYQIKIEDTGYGISEDELPYIFDRFYQVSHSQSLINTGTGIGLSLVKEIVALHGGNIQVQSKVGEGTSFTINLYKNPEISDSSVEASDFSPTDQETGFLNEAVEVEDSDEVYKTNKNSDLPLLLLVDDNVDILNYLQMHLSKSYRVITQESSKNALTVLENQSIDLIISDVIMPEPNGFELCEIIRGNPEWNEIPIILLTAQVGQESKIEGLGYGADDYLTKPFSATELMVRVENLIEIRRLLRKKYSDEIRIEGEEIDVSSEDARFLKEVQHIIEQYMDNNNFGVDWLASEVNLSARQLQRKVKAITSLSAGGYIRMLRLERARQLLAQRWGNISEVSDEIGFQNSKYFSRLFKQTFGVTPTEIIQESKSE